VIKYPTGSKLWLNEQCLGWHTVDEPPVIPNTKPNKPADFGTYMHAVAENETRRRYLPMTLGHIERAMTAEMEAAFNPHYDDEIGAPMDAESWGGSVVALQNELFSQFPASDSLDVCLEEVGSYTVSGFKSRLKIKNREYDSARGIYGTGDLIYPTAQGDLVVVDWKTGKKAISPVSNIQLEFEALAWLLDWPFFPTERSGVVWLVIGDLRNQELRICKASEAEIVARRFDFINGIGVVSERNSNLTPGIHCNLCPRAANCPALLKKVTVDAAKDPKTLTGDEIAEIAVLTRKVSKEYRELLIHRAETEPDFRSKYLTKGPKGWRLSAYDVKE